MCLVLSDENQISFVQNIAFVTFYFLIYNIKIPNNRITVLKVLAFNLTVYNGTEMYLAATDFTS